MSAFQRGSFAERAGLHGLEQIVPDPETPPPQHQAVRVNARLVSAGFAEILVGLAVLVSASISILLTQLSGGIAMFWPANAIAAALLIRLPRVQWLMAAITVTGALFIASVAVAHRSWPLAASFAGINAVEIALTVAIFRFVWAFPYPNISVSTRRS